MSQSPIANGNVPCRILTAHVELPAEVLDEIVERVLAELPEPTIGSPYLAGWQAAADYLAMPASTLKHAHGVPRRKVGGSVLFRRDELDAWADAHFEGATRFQHGSRESGGRTGRAIAGARPPGKQTVGRVG